MNMLLEVEEELEQDSCWLHQIQIHLVLVVHLEEVEEAHFHFS